jgi:hypothetical protein
MKEKKDVYQLYNLKLKKEQNELKNFIVKRNTEKNRLLEELKKDEEKLETFYNEIYVKKRVTPQMIFLNRSLNDQEKEKKIQQIQKIEYEIRMVKAEYLKIKNKQDKLEEKSNEKKEKIESDKERKEISRAIEDGSIKKIINS